MAAHSTVKAFGVNERRAEEDGDGERGSGPLPQQNSNDKPKQQESGEP